MGTVVLKTVETVAQGTPEYIWANKPSPREFGIGQAWFSDLGVMGYSNGVNWVIRAYRHRPLMLAFGNSIAQQCCSLPEAATHTTAASNYKAGTTDIVLTSVTGLANSDQLVLPLYSGRLFRTTVANIVSTTVTLATALPELLRASTGIMKYTGDYPNLNSNYGIVNAAVALLGGPVDVVPSYGYGGSSTYDMMADLVKWLDYYKPQYCAFHLWENDIANASVVWSTDQLKAVGRYCARMCLDRGCTPILFSSVPYTTITAARALDYDEILRWCLYDLATEVPGAIGADASTLWLDTSNATYPRSPTSGWTDNVHPNTNKRFSVGLLAGVPVFQNILPTHSSMLDYVISSKERASLTGTGGTNTGGTVGSVVPANQTLTVTGSNGCVATTSKNADGSLKFVATWPNAASRTGDIIHLSNSWTIPISWAGCAQNVRGYAKFKINSKTDIDQILISVYGTNNATQTGPFGSDTAQSMPADRIIMLETPAFKLSKTGVSITIDFSIRPKTAISPSASAINLDLIEYGILPAYPQMPF